VLSAERDFIQRGKFHASHLELITLIFGFAIIVVIVVIVA
jgi:hypothetical protein